jgi:hypothetical protein
MYNVKIILAHNKQTYFQPKFLKNNMDNKNILQQTKIGKKNLTFQIWPKNLNLDNSSHTSKKLEEVLIWNKKSRSNNVQQGVAKGAISWHSKELPEEATRRTGVLGAWNKEQQEKQEHWPKKSQE